MAQPRSGPSHLAVPGAREGPASTRAASLCSRERSISRRTGRSLSANSSPARAGVNRAALPRRQGANHAQSLSLPSTHRWSHAPRFALYSAGTVTVLPRICAQGIDSTADPCHNDSALHDSTDCSNHRSAHRSRQMAPQTCRDHHAPTGEAASPLRGHGRAERRATRSARLVYPTSVGQYRRIAVSPCRHGVTGRTVAHVLAISPSAAHSGRARSIPTIDALPRASQPSDGHLRSRSVRPPCGDFPPALSTNDLGGGDTACD